MNNINFNRFFTYFEILLTLLLFGCKSPLPHERIGSIDHRQVEYSLIRNSNGSAVVVFENGLNGKMNSWNKIVPEISRSATTFAYNRPGYGRSDPVPTPRDGLHIIDELRLLLRSNGLKPPYVIVGHSFGGLYMQLFARRYPEEVAGLVLVDSTHPNNFKGKGAIDNWPTWIRLPFLWYLSSTAKKELDLIDTTGNEVLALPSFTGKLVIVLSASRPMREKSTLADDANEKRKDIVNLYPGSKQVWVDSGHNIPVEKPESVIKAIHEVLESAEKTEAVMNIEQMKESTPVPNSGTSVRQPGIK